MNTLFAKGVFALVLVTSSAAFAQERKLPPMPVQAPKKHVDPKVDPPRQPVRVDATRAGAWRTVRAQHEGEVSKPSTERLEGVTLAPFGHKKVTDSHGMVTETRWVGVPGLRYQKQVTSWPDHAQRVVTRVKVPFKKTETGASRWYSLDGVGSEERKQVQAVTNPVTGSTVTQAEKIETTEANNGRNYKLVGDRPAMSIVRDRAKASRSGKILERTTSAENLERQFNLVIAAADKNIATATTRNGTPTSVDEKVVEVHSPRMLGPGAISHDKWLKMMTAPPKK
jgi:hypothetical protein